MLKKGDLKFRLHGEKLNGEFVLAHMRSRRPGSKGNEWLLIKSDSDAKPISKKRDNESCLSGRSMAEISRGVDKKPRSNRPAPKAAPKKSPTPKFIEPMKATLVEEPPSTGEWEYELKFDGYRALALKTESSVQLLSRNNKDFATRFPEITEAMEKLPATTAVFDGEIVALDAEGRPSFQLLQGLELARERPPLAYYIFDLLQEDGADLTKKPLHERRATLEKLLKRASEPIRFSATIKGDPHQLLNEVAKRGMEGLIGKEKNSAYEIGRRSRSWIKLKCVQEQEFVIGGYTPPAGTRRYFGALLVGIFQRKKLRFAGKVGTGFNTALLGSLYQQMKPLRREDCPFTDLPEKKQGRWAQNITPREMRDCHWIAPKLVCQVRFTEWTDDGKLRHPVFLGLREDKAATDVGRERAL
jgi:bifunctional non-homologous end joining protein LigD